MIVDAQWRIKKRDVGKRAQANVGIPGSSLRDAPE
jgi:hypothetical protein